MSVSTRWAVQQPKNDEKEKLALFSMVHLHCGQQSYVRLGRPVHWIPLRAISASDRPCRITFSSGIYISFLYYITSRWYYVLRSWLFLYKRKGKHFSFGFIKISFFWASITCHQGSLRSLAPYIYFSFVQVFFLISYFLSLYHHFPGVVLFVLSCLISSAARLSDRRLHLLSLDISSI